MKNTYEKKKKTHQERTALSFTFIWHVLFSGLEGNKKWELKVKQVDMANMIENAFCVFLLPDCTVCLCVSFFSMFRRLNPTHDRHPNNQGENTNSMEKVQGSNQPNW